jgi:two-component system phosphate regulon sensor histidine kinase PhoR
MPDFDGESATMGTESLARETTPKSGRARRPGPRDPAAGYRRIAWLIISLVLVPSSLLLAVGVTLLLRGSREWNLMLGILVLVFCGLLATGSTLVWVFIAKEQNLSQLQTDFVSKVGHELKTPLTSIRLFVDTLKLKRATDPQQLEACIDVLATETERLTRRIDQLLEWGRMEAGRKVYDLREDDLGAAVREVIDEQLPAVITREAELSLHVDPGLPRAAIDRPALADALLNLIGNAFKYGGRPAVIDVRLHAIDGGKRVAIEVRDNGEGIPTLEHKRIFQKFYRRDDRLSRTREGSGLGLAIVAHVAKGHRGRVRLRSTPGDGATFIIELPAVRAST